MRFSRSEPGFVVSLIAHVGLLLAAVVLFGSAEKFEEAPEMIPIDVISDSDLNSVTKGEKTAKEVKPAPRVDRTGTRVVVRGAYDARCLPSAICACHRACAAALRDARWRAA